MGAKPKKPAGWVRKTADMAAYQREYRKAHPEKYNRETRSPEEERARYVRRMHRLHGNGWTPGRKSPLDGMTPAERRTRRNKQIADSKKRGRERDPLKMQKFKARKYLGIAVARGKVKREPCFVCGSGPAEGHHPDYSLPLHVVWLCAAHHREVHENISCVPVDAVAKSGA